jgi:hypothetical protein
MTVTELKTRLEELIEQGCGDKICEVWDTTSEEGGYFAITGFCVLDHSIEFYSDDID